MERKMIILSGPSGAGKTTIAHYLIEKFPRISFTVSATTRQMRQDEKNGVDYYFISEGDFRSKLSNGKFVEYQEVYEGTLYGTLKEELERIWMEGEVPLLDIDVKGAVNLMENYGGCGLFIFIQPGDPGQLKERLKNRGTEDEISLQKRLSRAREELTYSSRFDVVLVNDKLTETRVKAAEAIREFIEEDI